ncbi:GNAT family N-acetyltransferase [Ruminococcus gauvreauii]|uniref:N-acetyltransferase n=1 Tax=Ruminococcus gauvreauii TaxID=438033 RepID=A0ABY5VH08_9FIRM|nr:GNAT family N-acetyltransferase [Ruminococcus gauvreauii]UWP59303.1 N-acetyltransferase [Ruminococcus gauvreauii]
MNFNYDKNRIYLPDDRDNTLAEVTFPSISDDTVNINHTFVDHSLRGQGVAGKLMNETAKFLQDQNKKAVLTCSYAVKWFGEHPEYEHLIR